MFLVRIFMRKFLDSVNLKRRYILDRQCMSYGCGNVLFNLLGGQKTQEKTERIL